MDAATSLSFHRLPSSKAIHNNSQWNAQSTISDNIVMEWMSKWRIFSYINHCLGWLGKDVHGSFQVKFKCREVFTFGGLMGFSHSCVWRPERTYHIAVENNGAQRTWKGENSSV
jgi:hypothetical protein